jgi:hypothetical protein
MSTPYSRLAQIIHARDLQHALDIISNHPEVLRIQEHGSYLVHKLAASDSPFAVTLLKKVTESDQNQVKLQDRLGRFPIEVVRNCEIAQFFCSTSDKATFMAGLQSAAKRDTVEVLCTFVDASMQAFSPIDIPAIVDLCLRKESLKCLNVLLEKFSTQQVTWRNVKSRSSVRLLLGRDVWPTQKQCESIVHVEVLEELLATNAELVSGITVARWLIQLPEDAAERAVERLESGDISQNLVTSVASMNKTTLLQILLSKADAEEAVKGAAVAAVAASRHGSVDVLMHLLDAYKTVRDLPLYAAACDFCHMEIVALLDKHGVSAETTTEDGESSLHILARATGDALGNYPPPVSYAEIVGLMIERLSGLLNLRNRTRGDTALHVAVRESNWTMVRTAVKSGARTDVLNDDNMTARDIAEKQDSNDTFDLILSSK